MFGMRTNIINPEECEMIYPQLNFHNWIPFYTMTYYWFYMQIPYYIPTSFIIPIKEEIRVYEYDPLMVDRYDEAKDSFYGDDVVWVD